MRNAKVWLHASLVVAVLAACALMIATLPSAGATQDRDMKDHWRNHDGHWSYWNSADKAWYYTDGKHWYYHDRDEKSKWRLYEFDKSFGREGFEKGTYKAPGVNIKIDLPIHGIFVPR
jgi:hypothetical protein